MKVNFIVAPSFLRTAEKTDPFYDPIISTIDGREGLDWKVFVWRKGLECGYPSACLGDYRLLDACATWFYRACRLVAWKAPAWTIYYVFGRVARPFFARKFKADIVITQSGQFASLLAGLLPLVRIVDIQHGVIYSRHSGYFDETGRLLPVHQACANREFWVYGQGFADCFFKHPDNARDLNGRVKMIGDVIRHPRVDRHIKKLIVVSGQFKPECGRQCLLDQVERLREFLNEVDSMFAGGCKVLLKHHPRFKGVDALDLLYKDFPFFEETKESWEKLYVAMKIHVTFSSTVVFDAASNGIISYLIPPPNNDPVLENCFWRDDYHYPYFGKSFKGIVSLCDAEGTAATIKDWYAKYYEPFSEQKCLELLTKKGGHHEDRSIAYRSRE